MQSDSFVLEQAMSSIDLKLPFVRKDVQILSDLNNGTYSANQVTFETTGLSNATNWLDYNQGLILLPVVMSVTGTKSTNPGGVTTNIDFTTVKSDFMLGLKNSHISLISSMSVDMGGTNIVQITNNIAQFLNFKLHSKMTSDEELKWGDMIGYSADSPNSWSYSENAGANGHGLCNNAGIDSIEANVAGSFAGSTYFNKGLYRRQLGSLSSTNNGHRTVFNNGTDAVVKDNGQDFIVNTTAGSKVYYLHCFIRLKDLLFFHGIPLLKSAYFKIILNINQCSFTLTKGAGSVMTVANTSFGGSLNPVMVSASSVSVQTNATGANANAYTADATIVQCGMASFDNNAVGGPYTYSFNVKLAISKIDNYVHPISQCRMYVPSYVFAPDIEKLYLTNNGGAHKHTYTDVSLQIVEVGAGGAMNPNLGFRSRLRRIVCIPILSATANGTGLGLSPLYSPFTTEGATTSPLLPYIKNFQLELATAQGYKTQITNVFEHFIYDTSTEGLNGGMIDGICSSKFNKVALENSYGYIDCQVRLREEDFNTPVQVIIRFNSTCLKPFQMYCFLEYEKNIVFDLAGGSALSLQL